MSSLSKALTLILVVLLIGGGLVFWKAKFAPHKEEVGLTSLSKEDMELLLKDANPMVLKRLAEDPEMRKKQVESIKEFLAIASEARKSGLADTPEAKAELENIRDEVIAVNYDREINKDKGEQLPPFSFITKEQIDAFYAQPGNKEAFDKFIGGKIEEAKKDGRLTKDPTEEELAQVRDIFAKVRIYTKEAEGKDLGEDFKRRIRLQVGLQQAQYLTRLYAEKTLAEKVKATDEEVAAYLAQHPELSPTEKKNKANEILQRVKGGEDFAKVADEVSEDPGTKGKGGLYEGIKKGDFAPEFENAALALEAGQIAPEPVETKFGYHIIKLEKKGTTKGENGEEVPTFDVRHILISTMARDPENPFAQPMTAQDKAKAEIEAEKEKKFLAEIVARNPIEIAENFEIKVPEMSPEQMMPPGMMMPPDGEGDEHGHEEEPSVEAPKGNETKKPAANPQPTKK